MSTPCSTFTLRAQLCWLMKLSHDECNYHLLGWAGIDKCLLPGSPNQSTAAARQVVFLRLVYLVVAHQKKNTCIRKRTKHYVKKNENII